MTGSSQISTSSGQHTGWHASQTKQGQINTVWLCNLDEYDIFGFFHVLMHSCQNPEIHIDLDKEYI
jgi:hypothetical protein